MHKTGAGRAGRQGKQLLADTARYITCCGVDMCQITVCQLALIRADVVIVCQRTMRCIVHGEAERAAVCRKLDLQAVIECEVPDSTAMEAGGSGVSGSMSQALGQFQLHAGWCLLTTCRMRITAVYQVCGMQFSLAHARCKLLDVKSDTRCCLHSNIGSHWRSLQAEGMEAWKLVSQQTHRQVQLAHLAR